MKHNFQNHIAMLWFASTLCAYAQPMNVLIANTPCYNWSFGCFGTGTGMFMAYWDRNGFSNIYTGSVNGGVATLTFREGGVNANMRALWATQAGFAGRHATNWGHYDNYGGAHATYQSTAPDPYIALAREEHEPECIGDFIGLNQNKWTNLNGECNGNIDAYAFNYFDPSGAKRVNFVPPEQNGLPIPDIQSGLKAFAESRGYAGDSFSQLADVWPDTPAGAGFTFNDLRREIDAGRPLLLFLQRHEYARGNGYNPDIHAFYAIGYEITASGVKRVRVRDGWTDNVNSYRVITWGPSYFYSPVQLYLRGVIGMNLKSEVTHVEINGSASFMEWLGPTGLVTDTVAGTQWNPHWHIVEASDQLGTNHAYIPVSTASPSHRVDFDYEPDQPLTVYRLRRLEPVYVVDTNLEAAVRNDLPVKHGPDPVLYDVEMEGLVTLDASGQSIAELQGLEYATRLNYVNLADNVISNINPLLINMVSGSTVVLSNNPLSSLAITNQIPVLQGMGVLVHY
jgi:hypothetical protein